VNDGFLHGHFKYVLQGLPGSHSLAICARSIPGIAPRLEIGLGPLRQEYAPRIEFGAGLVERGRRALDDHRY
jgi:hypothetical protein